MQIIAPKGTKDILPQTIKYWYYLEKTIREVCKGYGYEEIRTPIFEHTELFNRGIGDTTDIVEKEMYTFNDKGGRSITLRPENTAAVVRAFIEHKLFADNPLVKLFYIGPMFRYDKPQAGRFRQFQQFGAEALGLPGPDVDAEIIMLAITFLQKLGLQELALQLNSVGCPVCRPVFREKLQEFFKDKIDNLCPDCKSRLERNPLRILDCKNERCQEVIKDAPSLTNYLCDECETHFSKLQQMLKAVGVDYVLNDRLVRGLDYYTKTAFEIQYTPLGAQSAVCGGGRYDGLVQECGGQPTPAIGFAVGLERVLWALENQKLLPEIKESQDVFVIYAGENTQLPAFEFVTKLRQNSLKAQMDFSGRSLKSQLKLANRLNANYVIIIGEDELNKGVVTFKNMQTSEQVELKLEDIGTIISQIEVTCSD